MRVPLDSVARQADLVEQVVDAVVLLIPRSDLLDSQRLPDDRPDTHSRVERGDGSWNISCRCLRYLRSSLPRRAETSRPDSKTLPEVGCSSADDQLARSWSSPSRTRRPARRSRPRYGEGHVGDGVHRSGPALQGAAPAVRPELLDDVPDLEQHGARNNLGCCLVVCPGARLGHRDRGLGAVRHLDGAVDGVPARRRGAPRSGLLAEARRCGTCRSPCCSERRTGSPPADWSGRAAGQGCSAAAGWRPG